MLPDPGLSHPDPDDIILPATKTSGGRAALDPEALSRRIADVASDKQAVDVVMLDLRDVSLIADYFIICSAGSERQIKAITDEIVETLAREADRKPLHTEGVVDSGWVLLDYGSVVVHIFSQEMRAFYHLEKIWATAVPILRIA